MLQLRSLTTLYNVELEKKEKSKQNIEFHYNA